MTEGFNKDTIFALASARGRSGVAVFRISGPAAFTSVSDICDLPPTGGRGVRILRNSDGSLIDEALVLSFADKASFTGEAVVELQTHGGVAIQNAVLSRLGALPEFRLAEPGEFTRRALENGRLDLAQVEGLSDLIDAETEAQRSQALALMQGGLSERTLQWRKKLIHAVALIEATIDFADEDVPVDVMPEVLELIGQVKAQITMEIEGSRFTERLRDGFEVAILGSPNVGKSTLINAISGRDAAITSEYAGTTRDIVEVRYDLDGLPVTFLDTAGIRETDDSVENEGISRAQARAKEADIRVFLVGETTKLDEFGVDVALGDEVVWAKSDLGAPDDVVGISGITGFGVDALLERIRNSLGSRLGKNVSATRSRHRLAMQEALQHLSACYASVGLFDEVVSEELRGAIFSLNSLIGKVDVEQVLDVIFAEFCLGK